MVAWLPDHGVCVQLWALYSVSYRVIALEIISMGIQYSGEYKYITESMMLAGEAGDGEFPGPPPSVCVPSYGIEPVQLFC